MIIRPLRPLIIPAILLVVIAVVATTLPTYKPFDDAIMRAVQSLPDSWVEIVKAITSIGDVPNLLLVAFLVTLWELHRRNKIRALAMLGSLVALPTFYLIKETVQRARPISEFIAQHDLHGYSFPSGHATGVMAVYGMIAFLAYSHLRGLARVVVVGACALVIVLVSLSRVYLGVHYPTDVIAGWLLGFVVISLLRTLSLYLAKQQSGPSRVAIEDTTEDPGSIGK